MKFVYYKIYTKLDLFYLIFLIFILIYGTFSSPTPEDLSFAEYISGFLLLLLIFISQLTIYEKYKKKLDYLFLFSITFYLYYLIIPTVRAISLNIKFFDYFRDFVAINFFFLFLFFYNVAKKNPYKLIKKTTNFICFLGFAFALKYLYLVKNEIINFSYFTAGNTEYYSADPSLLFASVYSIAEAVRYYIIKNRIYFFYIIFFILTYIPLLLTGFRLQSTLCLMSLMSVLIFYFFYRPIKILKFVIFFVIIFLPFYDYFLKIFNLLIFKNLTTGFNNRFQELQIINNLNIDGIIFGIGWGTLIETPLLETPVRFVHNYFIYFFLKTGIFGLLITIFIFLFSFYVSISKCLNSVISLSNMKNNNFFSVNIAIISCLIYVFLFSGAFKSLTTGLLLIIVNCFYLIKKYKKKYD
jgi:hypothetical protein